MGHPRQGIQNPRLSWIPSHGATFLGPSANGNEQCRIQGRGPEGRDPLFFRPEGPRKFFFETAPPPFSQGLDDRRSPPPPTLSEGLDPPLMKVTPKIPILPNSKLNGNHMLILRRFSVISNSARDANGSFMVLLLSSDLWN